MNKARRNVALEVRIAAAQVAHDRAIVTHISNGDESKFSGDNLYLASFTKGLPHCHATGLLDSERYFRLFVLGIRTGNPADFNNTPLGPNGQAKAPNWKTGINAKVRGWESAGAGLTFDLEGPDAQAVTMPPAPKLGSIELTSEIAEVYSQAILRDVPFNVMLDKKYLEEAYKYSPKDDDKGEGKNDYSEHLKKFELQVCNLNKLDWFNGTCTPKLTIEEEKRRRTNLSNHTAFRGQTTGDDIGPYLSQFLLAGDKGLDKKATPKCGYIHYGSIRIDQRVRTAKVQDFMTTWDEWFDVQNGADQDQVGLYKGDGAGDGDYRFITTPRDLATYVHNDALYEAYLNACLLLLNNNYKFDSNIPFQDANHLDHQQGFAQFGGPHILSLVTEVATRALKAVRFQKFNIHRRMRPEALAARFEKCAQLPQSGKRELEKMLTSLRKAGFINQVGALAGVNYPGGTAKLLLPMAFPEGSPMHPSYGAGHATVAGACVTVLKAFFDHSAELDLSGEGSDRAYIPTINGKSLITIKIDEPLTVEGELNKLASNISIGRDWAGVHYYTDYIESIRMGEKIALGILEEQKLTYSEEFSMTVPLFDGGVVTI